MAFRNALSRAEKALQKAREARRAEQEEEPESRQWLTLLRFVLSDPEMLVQAGTGATPEVDQEQLLEAIRILWDYVQAGRMTPKVEGHCCARMVCFHAWWSGGPSNSWHGAPFPVENEPAELRQALLIDSWQTQPTGMTP